MTEASPAPQNIKLLRETAAGPMSAVFVGRAETRLGARYVAVKLLRELPDGGVERLLDLRDRARPLALIDHKHHTPVLDIARVDERFALVSPFIDGLDLLDWCDLLAETGRVLPRRVSCEILRSIASALDAATHRHDPQGGAPLGLVHRDLKPSNVMITRDGALRVTDFGTGYTALAGRAARAGVLKKGLVRYLSPERREGERASGCSDIYALGILAVELFRGRWLRRLRTRNPAHDRQLADVIARLDDLQMRSDSDDRSLRNLLLRMVAFDADARPDVTEVVSTLRTLTDRAEGPSLESFAIAHAVPWMDEIPSAPEPALVGATAAIVERGQPLPPAGGGLPIVTMPDRYDLQIAAAENDTGEWSYEEVTDPRIRQTPQPAEPRPPEAPLGAQATGSVGSSEPASSSAALSSQLSTPGAAAPSPSGVAAGAEPESRLAPLPAPPPAVAEPVFFDESFPTPQDPSAVRSQLPPPPAAPSLDAPLDLDDDIDLPPTDESPRPDDASDRDRPLADGAQPSPTTDRSMRWFLVVGGLAALGVAGLIGVALVIALVLLTSPGALP